VSSVNQASPQAEWVASSLPELEADIASRYRFECSTCGQCCSQWRVPIDAKRADYLRQQVWVQDRLKETGLSFLPAEQGGYRLPLTHENTCVFFDTATHYCLIQQHEGPEAKPTDCQRFPFAAVTVAGQSPAFEVTAACSQVSKSLLFAYGQHEAPIGLDAKACLDHAEAMKAHGIPVKTVAHYPPPFQWMGRWPWEKLTAWSDGLRDALLNPKAEIQSSEALLMMAKKRLDFSRLDSPILSSPFSVVHRKWLLTLEPLLVACFARKPYGIHTTWAFLSQGTYRDSELLGSSATLELKQVWQTPWPQTAEGNRAGEARLRAFTFLLLTRKLPLAYGQSLYTQLSTAFVGLVLTRFYARCFAALCQEPSVQDSHVQMAIRVVERYHTGHAPDWLATIYYHPFWPWLALGL
jgi:Fe-S-cluster containining protein